MKAADLYSALLLDSTTLVLTPTTPALGTLAGALAEAVDATGRLTLTGATKDAASTDDVLVVKGAGRLLGQDLSEIKGVFRLAQGTVVSYYLAGALPAAWTLPDGLPSRPALTGDAAPFSGLTFTKPCVVVAAGMPEVNETAFGLVAEVLDDGVRVCAAGAPGFAVGAVAAKLPDGFKATFAAAGGPARVRGRLAPRGRIPTAQLDLWWDAGTETVAGAPVINSGLRLDLAGSAFGVLVLAELAVGTSDLVTLGSALGDLAKAGVFQAEVSPPLGLDALADLYGIVGATIDPSLLSSALSDGALPSGTAAPGWAITELSVAPTALRARLAMLDASLAPFRWQPVSGVELSGPLLDVDIDLAGTTTTLAYAATAQLDVAGGYEFDVVYAPGVKVAGWLAQPTDVPLTALVEAVFGPLGLPDFRLALREAGVAYSIPDKTMRFELALDGELDLLGGHALVLKDVRLDVERSPSTQASGTLSGVFELAKVPIQVSATGTAATGWTFESAASPSQPLALARLADDLLHGWGAAIPPEALAALGGVTLSNLYTRFELATRDLVVEADLQWTPPADLQLPWAGFQRQTTHLSLASRRDPGTGRRSVAVELRWACIAEGRVFEAGGRFAPDDTSFFLLWEAAGSTTLGLTSLLRLLGLDNPLGDIAGWGLFDYRRFAIDFDRGARTLSVLAETAAGPASGHFETRAVIGGASPLFSASWQPDPAKPGTTLSVDDLLRAVGMTTLIAGLPGGVKEAFTFKALALRYTHRPQPTLLVTAESAKAGYDKAILGAGRNADGTWGALFAVTFDGTVSVAKALPDPVPADVSQLLAMFKPTFLLVSTVDNFTVPTTLDGAGTMDRPAVTIPPFMDGKGQQTTPFGTSRQRLRKGATLGGRLDFSTGDGLPKILRERFGWQQIEGRLLVAGGSCEVETLIPGTLSLPTGKEFGLELHEARLVLGVEHGTPSAAIQGACDVRLLELHARYDLVLAVGPQGLDGRIHATEPPLPPPQLLPGVRFKKDYWVDVGIVFEPAGFKLGLDADFYIGPNPAKYCGKARFVLDLHGPVPNPIYLGGAIDQLDAWAMFEAAYALSRMSEMVGTVTAGRLAVMKQAQSHYENLQSFAEVLQLENARFHWAESRVTLPDGTVVSPGAGFEGTLDVFGWTAYGMFEFATDPPGLLARLEVSPLHLQHVLSVTGDGQGMRRDGAFVVQPGGAVLQVNSGRPPFLHADLHVTLFDLLHTDVTADVTADGFRFTLRGNAGGIVDLTLACSLTTQGGFRFGAYGSFGLHLDLDLGPIVPGLDATRIHLDAGLDATLDVTITADAFRLTVAGSFEFEGTRLAMPDLALDVPFGSLADLPGKIVAHIEDNARDIFHDVWGGVADTVARIADDVKQIGEKAIDDVKQAGQEAAEAVEAVGRDLEDRAAQAEAAVSQAAAEIATAADLIAADATAAVAAVKNAADKAVHELATEAAAVAAAAVQAVAAIEHEVEQKVAAVAVEIAHALEEAEHEIAVIQQAMEREVRALLDDAQAVAAGLEREAAAIVHGIEAQTQKLRDEIAVLVRRAAEALRAAAAAAARRLADAAQSVGSC